MQSKDHNVWRRSMYVTRRLMHELSELLGPDCNRAVPASYFTALEVRREVARQTSAVHSAVYSVLIFENT